MKKKISMLVGIISMSAIAFGSTSIQDSKYGYGEEDKIEVRAEVVAPIQLNTSDVDFGKVAQGTNNNQPIKKGEIHISSANLCQANYRLTVYAEDKQITDFNTGMELKKDGLNIIGKTLTYKPKFYANGEELVANAGVITLKGDIHQNLSVGGTLNVPGAAETGVYKNNMTVRVTYDTAITSK